MKRYIILLVLSVAFGSLSAQEVLQKATDAYSKGDFQTALTEYTQALKDRGESAAVYYNIGNCYYKLNKTAPAILNYERALLFDPGNGDVRFNLEVAKLKTVDKIEPVQEFFLTDWMHSLRDTMNANEWSRFSIACFLLFIGALVLFFFSRKILLKKTGFYAGIVLIVFIIAGNAFAYNQKQKLTNRNTAIVMAATTTIKSSPDNSGTDLFILHEGTKVSIKSKLGDWKEIETADGNVGWIKNSEIEVI